MKVDYVPIDSVRPHPRNAREGDVGAIVASIRANGLYRPLVVQRSTGFIVAGNHTYRALVELGVDEAPVVYIDCDDEAALRILVADNRTADLATYDDAALASILSELAASASAALAGTGYTALDLGALQRDLDTSVTLPGGRSSGEDPTERAAGWEATDLRQIVLVLTGADFARAIGTLAEMQRADATLETNTACIVALADAWAAAEGWEPRADADAAPPG